MSTTDTERVELVFARNSFFDTLASQVSEGVMSSELAQFLETLIACVLCGHIRPTPSVRVLKELKHVLSSQLWIDQQCYQIVLFVPFDVKTHRTFVELVPWYPNGNLVLLEEYDLQ